LLDSEKRIRGFYDISLRSELDRLEDEIKVQLVEEVRNNPLKVERK
jgi:protein SCO1/2